MSHSWLLPAADMKCWLFTVVAICLMCCSEQSPALDSGSGDRGPADQELLDAAIRQDRTVDQRRLLLPDGADGLFTQYIQAVFEAELSTGYEPMQMLAMMRQLYYGETWSVTSTDVRWTIVIPCSPKLGDPRAKLGDELFSRLGSMAELGGVDLGHLFAGLEAMVCPAEEVISVQMSNEDFATWGGDLGAAVASSVACPLLGAQAANLADCGRTVGPLTWEEVLAIQAPPQDLEGDLDPYAVRATLLGLKCEASLLQPLSLHRPISEILAEYYLRTDTPLGLLRAGRNRCVLEALGGHFVSDQLSNRPQLVSAIAAPLASFAFTYFYTLLGRVPAEAELAELQATAEIAAAGFLEYLESGI